MTASNSKCKMTRSACGLRAKIRPVFWSPRAMVVAALAHRLLVMGFAYPLNLNALPTNNLNELRKVQLVGEPAYMAEKQREAKDFVTQHPFRFGVLTLRRILYSWTNLWDSRARWTLDELGVPHILLYTLASLLAFAGFGWAIQNDLDGLIPLAIVLVCFPMIFSISYSDFR